MTHSHLLLQTPDPCRSCTPGPELETWVPRAPLLHTTHNPHENAVHSYIVVDDLAQSYPIAMLALKVLQICPSLKKALLTTLGSINPSDSRLKTLKFIMVNHDTHQPLHFKNIGNHQKPYCPSVHYQRRGINMRHVHPHLEELWFPWTHSLYHCTLRLQWILFTTCLKGYIQCNNFTHRKYCCNRHGSHWRPTPATISC